MRNSDIFDDYAKIAMEKGLIKKASPESLQKKMEDNPRWDSLDISAIEALYGVKPETPKDMQYKRNIIEDAHPESVVVSPAYDKINGLVENVNERQDIICNMIKKVPNGNQIQRKYAEKQLVLSLVRLGNDLDNSKKDELRKLADTCLEQITSDIKKKEIRKTANPALIVGAVVAVLGAIWIQQHLDFKNDGFVKNHEKLIAELDDMIEDRTDYGVYGQNYIPSFKQLLSNLKSNLVNFKNIYDTVVPVIENIETPKTAQELLKLSQGPKTNTIKQAYERLKNIFDQLTPYLNTIDEKFNSESYKLRQIQEKGLLNKLVDYVSILHGGKGLIADDFDDVRRAYIPYKKSIDEIFEILQKAKSIEENSAGQLQKAISLQQPDFSETSTTTSETTPAAKSSTETPKVENEGDAAIEDLENQLKGFVPKD